MNAFSLLLNLPILLWMMIKPPTTAELLKIIETEKEKNRRLIEETQSKQSTLLSK